LNNFLDLKQPSGGTRPGTGAAAGVAAGGAAGAFLNDRPSAGQQSTRPSGGERPAAGQRPGGDNRPGAGNRQGSRPDRIENRGQRNDQRNQRRDQVRDQFKDHHPRADFWSGHPNAARWGWNRPYRWATWGLITGWFPGSWGQANYYDYGENIYYDDDSVYYGDEVVASSEEYAQQAQDIATSAEEPGDDSEWLPLGVFALVQDGQASGPPPTIFLQLTVSKEGVIAGTVTNTETDGVKVIEGAVDKKTQRSAWVIQGKDSPIMETGIANLTKDEAPALLHFADGQTQQWLLVRLEEPESEAGQK
jgi:hypothetical protein